MDFVSEEAEIAGKYAALTAQGERHKERRFVRVLSGSGINTCVPQRLCLIEEEAPIRLLLRAARPMRQATLTVSGAEGVLFTKRLAVVKPSEMIAADMNGVRLGDLTEDVTVSIEEGTRG